MAATRRGTMGLIGAMAALAGTRAAAASPSGGVLPRVAPAPWLRLAPGARGLVRFTIDMAILGHTDAPNSAGRIGDRQSQNYFSIDVRGDNYFVEGLLYPGGTLPAPRTPQRLGVFPNSPPKLNNEVIWDFTRAEPEGHFFNRGWAIINGQAGYTDTRGTPVDPPRTEPHLLSQHDFMLGRLSGANLSPETILTSGVENGNDMDAETVVRSVVGGTGRFRFARGEVAQVRLGRNTTKLRSFSERGDVFSPNHRFEFELRLDS